MRNGFIVGFVGKKLPDDKFQKDFRKATYSKTLTDAGRRIDRLMTKTKTTYSDWVIAKVQKGKIVQRYEHV